MRFLLCLFCTAFCFSSCLNDNQEKPVGIHPDVIFHDYKLTADEDRGEVTLMLQYRLNGYDGEPILLEAPSKVSLDGAALTSDSARFTGTFYEVSRSVQDFKGSHTITFTDNQGKEHKTEFSFEPIALTEEFGEEIPKKPFNIQLSGFSSKPTPVRLVMIDTSYKTADVNEELNIRDGLLRIDETKLANLAKGPVTLELYKEEERPLPGISKSGGRISMTYGLRRQFELVD